MRRRQLLSSIATASVVGAASVASGQYAAQPEHVTITGYDDASAEIERYQPLFDTRDLLVDPNAVYAWKVTSGEYDYDWYCYWCFYTIQEGLTEKDTHLPDREPVYVAVADGAVDHILFSEYHYSVARSDSPTLYDGTHPQLGIVRHWHQYYETDYEGVFAPGPRDMTDVYSDWLVNGWGVNRRAVVDPPYAEQHDSWWPDTTEAQADHRLALLFGSINDSLPFGLDIPNPFRST